MLIPLLNTQHHLEITIGDKNWEIEIAQFLIMSLVYTETMKFFKLKLELFSPQQILH